MRILYKKLCMPTMIILSTLMTAHAQQTVTGVVTDANGPVPGVTVSIQGTNRGTQTDVDGRYSIQATAGETMQFYIIGYKAHTIVVCTSTSVSVMLEEDASQLDEVVVTALGIQRAPKELGYAMSTVKAEELTKTGSPNFAGALYGKAPGVRISAA